MKAGLLITNINWGLNTSNGLNFQEAADRNSRGFKKSPCQQHKVLGVDRESWASRMEARQGGSNRFLMPNSHLDQQLPEEEEDEDRTRKEKTRLFKVMKICQFAEGWDWSSRSWLRRSNFNLQVKNKNLCSWSKFQIFLTWLTVSITTHQCTNIWAHVSK